MRPSDPDAQALHLLEQLFDGVASPQGWNTALRSVGASLGGQYVALVTHHSSSQKLLIDDASNLLPEVFKGFQSMQEVDPARAAIPLLATGKVYIDHDFHGVTRLERSPFYADFLHGHGIGHYALLPAKGEGGALSVLSVQREKGRGGFTSHETRLMSTVQAHFRQAMQLRRQLNQREAQTLLLEKALDALSFPILVCSMSGHVHSSNIAGQHWLLQPGCPMVRPDLLPAAMRRMLEQACGHGGQQPRAAAWQPLNADLMIALPLAPIAVAGGDALALLAIQGPRWGNVVPEEMLRALFGLTPAEIRLVQHLMQCDEPLPIVAEQMHLSLNTLRTQLKAIFQKTHTRRQSGLLRLMRQLGLLTVPAGPPV